MDDPYQPPILQGSALERLGDASRPPRETGRLLYTICFFLPVLLLLLLLLTPILFEITFSLLAELLRWASFP